MRILYLLVGILALLGLGWVATILKVLDRLVEMAVQGFLKVLGIALGNRS